MGTQIKKEKINPFKKVLAVLIAIAILLFVATEFLYSYNIISFSPSQSLSEFFKVNPVDTESEEVYFLNVGQGDSTVIKSKGSVAVIDFGPENENNVLYRSLLDFGINKIDLAVITHNHVDHLGGFLNLAKNFEIKRLLINDTVAEDADETVLKNVLSLAVEKNIKIYKPKMNSSFKIGDATLKIIYTDISAEKENNRSVVSMLSIAGTKILFTGDAESKVEKHIAENFNIDCDILKMGHHGSYTSTTKKFLEAASPKVAIASAGYDNIYSHPSKWAEQRLKQENIRMYRTDLDKTIRCRFDKQNKIFKITSERKAEF